MCARVRLRRYLSPYALLVPVGLLFHGHNSSGAGQWLMPRLLPPELKVEGKLEVDPCDARL
jgi:hypothetical protein